MTREPSHKPPSQETIEAFVRIVGEAARHPRRRRHGALSRRMARPLSRQGGARAQARRDRGGRRPFSSSPTRRARRSCRKAAIPGWSAGRSRSRPATRWWSALERLNRVRDIDLASNTMTVEAGLVLAQAQQVAASAGRLFPLSLASEGSCQIGGVLATNAGGIAVLAYGSARDLTLGLEVVLADGQRVERAQVAAQGQFRLRPQGPRSSARRGRSASSPRRCCASSPSRPSA